MEKGNTEKSMKKKRGRPPKRKRLEEAEELKSNSLHATAAHNTNASSSSPAETNPTSPDEPLASKPRTKYALAVTDKKATPSSPSSIKVDERSSETSEADRVNKANHVKVEAKYTATDLESTSPDKIIEARKGMTTLSKIMNQTPQTPEPELPKMEANAVSNAYPNLTVEASENPAISEVMSELEDPVIEVEGYKVKKEVEPLLKAIFKKYGDIARKSLFSMESRSCLLEMVCSIYKRLEASDIMQLTPLELDSMKGQIKDLELVKVNVGWLQERLNQISKVMEMDFKGRGCIDIVINERKRAVTNCELKLQKWEVRLQEEKDELEALQTCSGSLVHGLV